MICVQCRAAGRLNEKALWFVEEGRIKDAESTFRKSEDLHDGCEDRGCVCGHLTGRLVRDDKR